MATCHLPFPTRVPSLSIICYVAPELSFSLCLIHHHLYMLKSAAPSATINKQLNTLLQISRILFQPSLMSFRSTMDLGKTLVSRGIRGLTTSTTPKAKAYAPAADYGYAQGKGRSRSRSEKKDFVPVYVAIGMIALATGLGLHTAWQQLRNSPTVRVKKQRRETLPEVVEPEHVAEESDRFLKKSFFRKVAHVQDHNNPDKHTIPDPIHKDAYAHRPRIETLKSVGVDPSHL